MRIVLISPFDAERSALEQLLHGEGHEVIATATRREGLQVAASSCPDVIVADAQVPGLDGRAFVREVSRCCLPPRIILLCPRPCRLRVSLGVACLTKPIDLAELKRHLDARPAAQVRVA